MMLQLSNDVALVSAYFRLDNDAQGWMSNVFLILTLNSKSLTYMLDNKTWSETLTLILKDLCQGQIVQWSALITQHMQNVQEWTLHSLLEFSV